MALSEMLPTDERVEPVVGEVAVADGRSAAVSASDTASASAVGATAVSDTASASAVGATVASDTATRGMTAVSASDTVAGLAVRHAETVVHDGVGAAGEERYSTQLFDDNLRLFSAMIDDILAAEKYIYLETYRFSDDAIGKRFREALLRKAQEGLDIRILVDAYGTSTNELFFAELIESGVKLRYFKKIKLFFSNTFARNHTRSHRKLLLIDDKITYIGSSNLTSYSISWRDLNLRLQSPITHKFRGVFYRNCEQYKLYELVPFEKKKIISYHGYNIIQDTPSTIYQAVRDYALHLIRKAKSEIVIETPYFLPGYKFRKALADAASRGVKVTIYIPLNSDVPIIDLLRNKYLGPLYKQGIRWRMFRPDNLHAKCMLVDGRKFLMGSANLDYRSFRYQYEIMLYGEHAEVVQLLQEHIAETDRHCCDLDYEKWKNVPWLYRFAEWLITPFRRLF